MGVNSVGRRSSNRTARLVKSGSEGPEGDGVFFCFFRGEELGCYAEEMIEGRSRAR